MRTKGAALAKAACLEFVKELKSLVAVGQASDLASGTADATIAPSTASVPAKAAPPAARANASYVTSSEHGKTETCKLQVEYTFQLHPMFLYESLLDTNRMRAVTAADAHIEPKEGGRFSLFNGSIEGSNVTLEPGKRIVQKWRFNTWPAGHFSDVTISLAQDGGNTKLSLEQAGVPVEEKERTEKGWRAMIFDRLKMVLGGCPP
jgi:activator of HSP90 ATPase